MPLRVEHRDRVAVLTLDDPECRNALSVEMVDGIAAELGCTAYYRRQYQKAIAKYIRALNMKPDDVVGLWGLAKSYGQIGQYQKALEALARHHHAADGVGQELGYVVI